MIYILAFVFLAGLAWWLPGARDRWRNMEREDQERARMMEMHDRMEREENGQ